MKALYRGAQRYVSIARLLSALFYAVIALLLISFAVWLAIPFGRNLLLTAIAMLVGLQGAATGVKASELFLSSRPAERPNRQQGRAPVSGRDQGDRDVPRKRGRPDRQGG
jgi:hypothetical protein